MVDVADPCAECAGGCCSFTNSSVVLFDLEKGQRYDSAMIDYDCNNLLFEDGTVPEMDWYVVRISGGRRALAFDCGHLEDGLCSEYDRRPRMCREFECLALQGETGVEEWLESHQWPGSPWDHVIKDVTGRCREIIGRAAP